MQRVAIEKSDHGMQIGVYVHDVIPIFGDQFVSFDAYRNFREYLEWIDGWADEIYCNSNYSKADLVRTKIVAKSESAKVILLAHEFCAEKDTDKYLSRQLARGFIREQLHRHQTEDFVICVGTIEARKNQALLVQAWSDLALERRMPVLFLVGKMAHNAEPVRILLDREKPPVAILEDANDSMLAELYQACRFTIFPSLFEGWGLPVGESLWFGKPCLASNSSSVPEVGGAHAIYFDPLSLEDIKDKVRFFLNAGDTTLPCAPVSRDSLRTWRDVANELIRSLDLEQHLMDEPREFEASSCLKTVDSKMIEETELNHRMAEMGRLLNGTSQPNINEVWRIVKDLPMISLNLKFFGYEVARSLAEALPVRTKRKPSKLGLKSKPSTQADLESDWAAYWSGELHIPIIFHRKIWEFCFVLQALYDNDMLDAGRRGLGFGCGEEPLPSLFASYGIDVTVTDLEPQAAEKLGWVDTGQHTTSLAQIHQAHLVSREVFDQNVNLRYLDMNAIPSDVQNFDFCWSICAYEHLGSIDKGLAFVENSLNTLRPGGIAVHTTEFNFLNDKETIDNWMTVLFQRKHFEEITSRLISKGHKVRPLDFDVGQKPMDRFIDVPPYTWDWPAAMQEAWGHETIRQHRVSSQAHMKLSVDGFASTCFGLIIEKGEA